MTRRELLAKAAALPALQTAIVSVSHADETTAPLNAIAGIDRVTILPAKPISVDGPATEIRRARSVPPVAASSRSRLRRRPPAPSSALSGPKSPAPATSSSKTPGL